MARERALFSSEDVPPRTRNPELESWKAADRELVDNGMNRVDRERLDVGKLVEAYWGKGTLKRWQRDGVTEQDIEQLNVWRWLDWRRTARSPTVAEKMRDEPTLTERERQILSSLTASHMSAYQVVRIEPGLGIEVENILEGGRVFVHDRNLSLTAQKWVLAFWRVYAAGPFYFVAGGGHAFPPQHKEFIKMYLTDALKKYQRRFPGTGWVEFLQRRAEIFGRLTVKVHEDMMRPPILMNSDGELLALCEAHFEVKHPEEFAAALRGHPDLYEDEPARKGEDQFVWFREGKDDSLTLGRFALSGNKLTFECNSKKRLSQGMRLLKQVGNVELIGQSIKEGAKLFEEISKGREEGSGLRAQEDSEPPPEAQAFLRQYIERHFDDWVKQPLPALNGLTPRQAAKKPASRERLIDLIREIEYGDSGRGGGAFHYDFNKLRRRLGLPEE